MAGCRVVFKDSDGVQHSVEVDADSLYEAVAVAVSEFKQGGIPIPQPGAMTQFLVTAFRKPTEHKITLGQVAKWAEPTTKEGPAGLTKRERVRSLLGSPASKS